MPQIVTQEMSNWIGLNEVEDIRSLKPNELAFARDVEFDSAGNIVPYRDFGISGLQPPNNYASWDKIPQLVAANKMVFYDGVKSGVSLYGKESISPWFSDLPSYVGLTSGSVTTGQINVVAGPAISRKSFQIDASGAINNIQTNEGWANDLTNTSNSAPMLPAVGMTFRNKPRWIQPSLMAEWRGRTWLLSTDNRLRFSHPGKHYFWRQKDFIALGVNSSCLLPTSDRLLVSVDGGLAQVTGTIPETFSISRFSTPMPVRQMFTLNSQPHLVMINPDTNAYAFGRLRGQAIEMLPDRVWFNSDDYIVCPFADRVFFHYIGKVDAGSGNPHGYSCDAGWRFTTLYYNEYPLFFGDIDVVPDAYPYDRRPELISMAFSGPTTKPLLVVSDPKPIYHQWGKSTPLSLLRRAPKIVTSCAGSSADTTKRFHRTVIHVPKRPVNSITNQVEPSVGPVSSKVSYPPLSGMPVKYWKEGICTDESGQYATIRNSPPLLIVHTPGLNTQVALEIPVLTNTISKVIWSFTPKRQRRTNKGRGV